MAGTAAGAGGQTAPRSLKTSRPGADRGAGSVVSPPNKTGGAAAGGGGSGAYGGGGGPATPCEVAVGGVRGQLRPQRMEQR
eukprot:gene16965-biopygen12844